MKKLKNILHFYQKNSAKLLGISMAGVVVFAYNTLISSIPDRFYINDREEQINLPLPVVFTESEGQAEAASGNISSFQGGTVDDVEIESQNLTYNCKLFGIIPVKEVSAQVVGEKKLLAGGMPVGIYVETDGILVIGTGKVTNSSGDAVSPAEHLVKSGDYIREINGKTLENKEQLIAEVANCEDRKVILKILREGEIIEVAVEPAECEDGTYKLGIWVRDDLAGIGTLTYVTEQMEYGALGHGVSDADTGAMLGLKEGILYESNIVGIVKGKNGTPGELTGVINYDKSFRLGSIEENDESGIYGDLLGMTNEYRQANWLPVGYKQEIETGEAEILSTVDDTLQSYSVYITELNYHKDEKYREIMFKVTDEELLEKTGGIVQGMSGSPLVQNGKIIGAVTHVFVNDPTKGYGIFIEEMLEHN